MRHRFAFAACFVGGVMALACASPRVPSRTDAADVTLAPAPPAAMPPKATASATGANDPSGCHRLACLTKGEVCCQTPEATFCAATEEACARPDPPAHTWFYACLSPADCAGEPCAARIERGFQCGDARWSEDAPNDPMLACLTAADCPRAAGPAPRCEALAPDEDYPPPAITVCVYDGRDD